MGSANSWKYIHVTRLEWKQRWDFHVLDLIHSWFWSYDLNENEYIRVHESKERSHHPDPLSVNTNQLEWQTVFVNQFQTLFTCTSALLSLRHKYLYFCFRAGRVRFCHLHPGLTPSWNWWLLVPSAVTKRGNWAAALVRSVPGSAVVSLMWMTGLWIWGWNTFNLFYFRGLMGCSFPQTT